METNKQQINVFIPCALCASSNTRFFYSELNLTLRRCNRCRSVFVHPLPVTEEYVSNLNIQYDILANKYSQRLKNIDIDKHNNIQEKTQSTWSQKKALIYQRDLEVIKKYLKNKNPKDITVLDVGCGEGYFLRKALKNGFQCEGLEPSKTHTPQKELNFKIFHGFLKNFKPRKNYDVITLLDVLEHTKDPQGELRKIREIIKKDGLLMIRVPNLRWLIFKEKILRLFCAVTRKDMLILNPQGIYAPHTHLYNFSEEGLEKLLETCGFKIIGSEIIKASYSENIFKAIFYHIYYVIITALFKITKINFAISLNIFATPL